MNTTVTVNHNKKIELLNDVEFKLSINDSVHYKYNIKNDEINYVFSVSKEMITDSTITRVIKYTQNDNEIVKCMRTIDRAEDYIEERAQVKYRKVSDLFVNFYTVSNWNLVYKHYIDEINDKVKKLITTNYGSLLPTYNLEYKKVYNNKRPCDIVGISHMLMENKPTRLFFELDNLSFEKTKTIVSKIVKNLNCIFNLEGYKVIILRSYKKDSITQIIFDDVIMPSLKHCKDVAEHLNGIVAGINFNIYKAGSYLSQLGVSKRGMKPFIALNQTNNKSLDYYCIQPECENVTFLNQEYNVKNELVDKLYITNRHNLGIVVGKKYNNNITLCNLLNTCPICKNKEAEHNFIIKHNITVEGYSPFDIYLLGCMKSNNNYEMPVIGKTCISNVIKINDIKSSYDIPTLIKVDKVLKQLDDHIKENTLLEIQQIKDSTEIGSINKKRIIKLRYASILLKEISLLEDVGTGCECYDKLRFAECYNNITLERLQRAFISLYKYEDMNDLEFKKLIYKGTALSKLPKCVPGEYDWKKMIALLKHLLGEETYRFDLLPNRPYKGKAISSISLIPLN